MAHTTASTDPDDSDDELTRAVEFADRFIDEHEELFETLASE
jgi:hypothetical protein